MLLILILLSSCSTNTKSIPIKKTIKYDKRLYTLKGYQEKFKKEIFNHDEATYIGLTSDSLMLLNKPFKSATPEEINNDVAYNKKSMQLNSKYNKSIDFLKENKNLTKIANYLNYKTEEIQSIVFKESNALISFVAYKGSYESFLVATEDNILRIKLIEYLYAH